MGSVPLNLEVPSHEFPSDNTVIVGEGPELKSQARSVFMSPQECYLRASQLYFKLVDLTFLRIAKNVFANVSMK